jgi:hypothetical protein
VSLVNSPNIGGPYKNKNPPLYENGGLFKIVPGYLVTILIVVTEKAINTFEIVLKLSLPYC